MSGCAVGGNVLLKTTEKYDDVANTWTAKANLNTTKGSPAGFSIAISLLYTLKLGKSFASRMRIKKKNRG